MCLPSSRRQVRLEYLLIPLVFGIGAPIVALVGTNSAAGLQVRARRIALTGAVLAFAVTGAVGLLAAIFPVAWLTLFSVEAQMIDTGRAYLQIVRPFYGFYGLGLVLYFATQGQQRLMMPLVAGIIRLAIALGGGWLALEGTGDPCPVSGDGSGAVRLQHGDAGFGAAAVRRAASDGHHQSASHILSGYVQFRLHLKSKVD